MKKNVIAVLIPICVMFAFCKKPQKTFDQQTASEKFKAGTLGVKPNVLFIIVDDLRYWSIRSLYDMDPRKPNIVPFTPNIDAFINDASSVTFTNAHAPGIACTPSRTAFLTGKYPNETGVYRNGQDWQNAISKDETIFKAFRDDSNYMVFGAGKIFHETPDQAQWVLGDGHNQVFYDNRYKATESRLHDKQDHPALHLGYGDYKYRYQQLAEDFPSPDAKAATFCINKMEEMKNDHPDKSFFITCGFRQPHTPYIVDEQYVNASSSYPKSVSTNGLPEIGKILAACGPTTTPDQMKLNHETDWQNYLGAYRGSVRMLDEQIGRLLDGLQANGFKDNTIVVLISDHGFHLGEKNHVKKNTMWEETTRVPMIWRVPGKTKAVCNTAVDLMSIYPTLKTYCNLSKSLMNVAAKPLNGLIDNPASGVEEDFALTVSAADSNGVNRVTASVRTRDWRLIKYNLNSNGQSTEELYKDADDPWEETNLRPNPTTTIDSKLTSLRTKISNRMPTKKLPEATGAIAACQ